MQGRSNTFVELVMATYNIYEAKTNFSRQGGAHGVEVVIAKAGEPVLPDSATGAVRPFSLGEII